MHRTILVFVGTAASVMLAALPAGAWDLEDIQVHGFVNQSFIQTTENNVFTLESTDGSWDWFEAAVNLTTEPTDNLRIGLQLYARELGEDGNGKVVIDWANGDYRWRDWLGLRAGKNKLPAGLYNEVRDADMARPSILLPQGMYPEILRDFINSYLGAEVYGTIALGSTSDLSYQVYTGVQDLDDAYAIQRFTELGAAAGLRNLPFELDEAGYSISNLEVDHEYVRGFALRWSTPLQGLRIGASGSQSKADFSSTTTYTGWTNNMPVSIALRSDTSYDQDWSTQYSIDYRRGPLYLAGECYHAKTITGTTISGLPFPLPARPATGTRVLAYYGQAAYRFNELFQLSGYYSVFYPDAHDKTGDRFAATGQPDYLAWTKDLSLTARFDLSRHLLLKLEAHSLDGAAITSSLDNPDGVERDWEMYIARITFYF